MRRLLLCAAVALSLLAVRANADPLPPCGDTYPPGTAGTSCQVRADTQPTAYCNDATLDYSRSYLACSGHGGVRFWLPPPAPSTAAHTWYTSSYPATFYYCDDDPDRLRNDLPQYQQAFSTIAALLVAYPGRTLHAPCRDGVTGP